MTTSSTPQGTVALYVRRISQYQRSGNTRFVMVAQELTSRGYGPNQTVTLLAEECTDEVNEVLALLQVHDTVTLRYNEHRDMGHIVKLYQRASVGTSGA